MDLTTSGVKSGCKLPLDILPATPTWTIEFQVSISPSQVNTYWFIIAVHKNHNDSSNMASQTFNLHEFPANGAVYMNDAVGCVSFQPNLPRGQYMAMRFVKDAVNFTLYIDGVQRAQTLSSNVTFGNVLGDEGIRLGHSMGPAAIVASYKNFKIYDHAV